MFSDDVAKQFDPVPGYCNTASVGIPPRAAVEVLRGCLDAWAGGILDKAGFDADVARARDGFARLAGAPVATVAMPGAVSITSGLVASCLPEGSRVLCAEEDFTSVLFPFLVDPRLDVTVVPLDELLDQLGPAVDLVAASAVRIRGHRCTARPLRPAEDARRFSVSPAWFDVAATAEALEALLAVGPDRINGHNVELANRCRRALGLPDGDSAIVRVTTTSDPAEDLREAGVVTTSRGGGTRLSFHLTNTGDDADRVAAVLRSHVPT